MWPVRLAQLAAVTACLLSLFLPRDRGPRRLYEDISLCKVAKKMKTLRTLVPPLRDDWMLPGGVLGHLDIVVSFLAACEV